MRRPTGAWCSRLRGGSSQGPQALAALCEIYWYPLYAYVRRQGYNADDAQDLTQAFFARLIEKRDVRGARQERGRFRSFLLASMKHFLLNEARHWRVLKRGGGQTPLALDLETAEGRYLREIPDTSTPETLFDRQWALTVLGRALSRVRREAVEADKAREFDALKGCLTGEIPHGSYRALGTALGLSEGAVKVAVHRLRQRFQRTLRAEISETVLTAADVEEEIHYLFRAITAR